MKTISESKFAIRKELWIWTVLIALVNSPLLFGSPCSNLIFVPARVAAGEWWRVLTGFFVHVSWYHLLLDASAFLMLLESLHPIPRMKRLMILAACGLGSLAASVPVIGADGTLCGLSGIAHGLLAVMALQLIEDTDVSLCRAGLLCFTVVLAKCIFEAATGHVLFENMHLGNVASPVAVCHAGGVAGGVLMYAGLKGLPCPRLTRLTAPMGFTQ